ncbi:hypothetical protein BCD67_13790 [Oscillatoriales cyanobacterium USR001]|nr:hypothetical protein BCD67_13790 [Oscillatoriales cyanobacterium USR001]
MQHGIPNPTARREHSASQQRQLPIDYRPCQSLEPGLPIFSASAGDIYKPTPRTPLASRNIKPKKLERFFWGNLKKLTATTLLIDLNYTTNQTPKIPPTHKVMDGHFYWRFL